MLINAKGINMKKILILSAAALMILGITSCSSSTDSTDSMVTSNMLDDDTLEASELTIAQANEMEAELLANVGYTSEKNGYPIVDTNETIFYSNDAIIDAPAENEDFYGQDASYEGNQPSYTDNLDGTITDNVTSLMWQQDPGDKLDWCEAATGLDEFNEEELGGYSDW